MQGEVIPTMMVNDITHPFYELRREDWAKWRLTFEGGTPFKRAYLKPFSKVEDDLDFKHRFDISYVPAFAKANVIEVRNSIYQRLVDITRIGGSKNYQDAVQGLAGGVDLLGSSMNTFMGVEILEELIVMGRVGIYIDMPAKQGATIAENLNVRPYLYTYKTEDIRSWMEDDGPTQNQFKALLLRDSVYDIDPDTGLPKGEVKRYRFYKKYEDGVVTVRFFNDYNQPTDPDGIPNTENEIVLGVDQIPFVILDLNNSLLADIADYQIALMNLASSDMMSMAANFPFYTEQYDPRYEATHIKGTISTQVDENQGGVIVSNVSGPSKEIKVGPASGRRYPVNTERPGFIHPSSEPLKASLEKQEQMKIDMRLLINLAISNIQPKMASADSKGMDERTLESGLSYIGLVLCDAERRLADIWHQYENIKTLPTINYPTKYSLRNEKDVWIEVDELKKRMGDVPSKAYQVAIGKRIIDLLVGHRVTSDELKKMYKEVDEAPVPHILIDKIEKDVQLGYCDPELAADLRGYPEGTVKKAQEYQAKRLALIQISQSKGMGAGAGARGVPDASVDPKADVQAEKDAAGNPVRGKAAPSSNGDE